MEHTFDDLFFEHMKRERALVGEVESPKPNCRRWIRIHVNRQDDAKKSDVFVSALSRLAVGPFYWHLSVFDFNHVEHPLDDIEDQDDETGTIYREPVIDVTTTDLEMYNSTVYCYFPNLSIVL